MPTIITIKHRVTAEVIYSCEAPDDGHALRGHALRHALEKAVGDRADLSSANLRSADLRGANLRGANLRGADLSSADLGDLGGADFRTRLATPHEAIASLDRVREIVLDNSARLDMDHWHETDEWQARTCAEETLCETTHCLAGWLQVCSSDEAVRAMPSPQLAGILCAPIAAKMFFRSADAVLSWLRDRSYVREIEERALRSVPVVAHVDGHKVPLL